MICNFVAELRGVVKGNEFKRKDGSTGFNCQLLVESESRAYQLDADEQIYRDYENQLIKKGEECAFVADYNPGYQYKKFMVKEAVAL